MKMKIVGKQGGRFKNDSGETVTYRKVFAVKPAGYVDQQYSADRVVLGGEAGSYSCSQVVFDLLPDEGSEYQKGIEYDVEFDDKKRIVDIRDIAS